MGGEPWDYFVPYEENIQAALEKLRQREFRAGRYRGSEDTPATMEEAFENMGASGTASILDIMFVDEEPNFSRRRRCLPTSRSGCSAPINRHAR